ncbi:MAG: DUF1707 domain-containing protein [Solirubrobacterales bacterium]|nr:DUF1707 domain-containing protein [Solirubrobacterales bacterium]
MVTRSSLRASDSDRERVAERLRQATTEGRLLAHELEERLARTLRARTYGELDALVADLPNAPAQPRKSSPLALAAGHPLIAILVVVGVSLSVAGLLAAAVALVASGAWIAPLVLVLVLRARTDRHYRRLGPPPPGPGRTHPGR